MWIKIMIVNIVTVSALCNCKGGWSKGLPTTNLMSLIQLLLMTVWKSAMQFVKTMMITEMSWMSNMLHFQIATLVCWKVSSYTFYRPILVINYSVLDHKYVTSISFYFSFHPIIAKFMGQHNYPGMENMGGNSS